MTDNDAHRTGSEYLNVLAEMSEKLTEQTLTTINRSQQAVIEAVSNWAQTTASMMPQPPSAEALESMPKPAQLVDRGFEIAERLLAAQHSFAKKLMESLQGPPDRGRDQGCRPGREGGCGSRWERGHRVGHPDGQERLSEVLTLSALTARRPAVISPETDMRGGHVVGWTGSGAASIGRSHVRRGNHAA